MSSTLIGTDACFVDGEQNLGGPVASLWAVRLGFQTATLERYTASFIDDGNGGYYLTP